MDPDSPWEDNAHVDNVPEAEWNKITSDFTNTGYREGIIAGKKAFLQAGFDTGFASVGVPLGRELGNLRGAAAAIESFLIAQKGASPELEELGRLSSILSRIQFSDIVPRDLEAEQHAKEHLGFNDLQITENRDSGPEQHTSSGERYVAEDVTKVKESLALLSAKLGLSSTP